MQWELWAGAASSLALAGVALFGDRRRQHRTDPDRVGWVPWPLVLIIAMLAAAAFAAFAIKSGRA